jgi:co-chaperonin GroES (HSP10)
MQKNHMPIQNKVQPILDKVLIKLFPSECVSEGGIVVPESFAEENDKAWVVAVGNGTAKKPMRFTPGQVVHRVHKWGTELEIDGVKHYLMEDTALIAQEN